MSATPHRFRSSNVPVLEEHMVGSVGWVGWVVE